MKLEEKNGKGNIQNYKNKKKHCFGLQLKIHWDSVCLHTSTYIIQKQMYTTGLNFINVLIIKHTTYKQSQ